MTAARQDHPTHGQLHEYALGKGDPGLRAFVEEHLADCSSCAAVLLEAPADTLVGKLRDAGTVGLVGDTIGPAPDVPVELIDHPKYRIVRRLGAGGMGVVYQAVHKLMEREVALKVISAGLMRNPVAVLRFLQEVKAAARLNHPNIVAAHDAEQVGDLHFLVMEYVDGASLDRLVRKSGPMAINVACYMVRQALCGLQHAHEKGLVHRDLKPQNLMVTRKGQLKVLDFGLARLAEEAARPGGARPLTTVGTVVGTPDYIAPEQVSNSHTVDIRADIYSLGCTLYFLLTGRPPFPDGSPLEKALSHVQGAPTPLRSLRPEVPDALVDVVERMMARRPSDRYQTPGDAAQALLPFTKSGAPAAMPVAPPASNPASPTASVAPAPRPRSSPPTAASPVRGKRRPFWPWPWSWPWVAGAIAGVLLLGALIGLGFAWLGRPPTQQPHPGGSGSHQPSSGRPEGRPRILLVLPASGYWVADYQGLMRGLADRAEITIASSRIGGLSPSHKGGPWAQSSLLLENARADDFDAVIFCGGVYEKIEFAHNPEQNKHAARLSKEMVRASKPVAALCSGVSVLARAGLLKGKRAAAFEHLRAVLRDKGAEAVDQAVVEDGDVLTGRGPADAEELADRLLARLRRP